MPVFVFGLPLHALVVHAVVVLVPLAVVGTVAVALWPKFRVRFGWPIVGLTAVATATIPIATSSGEDLRDRLVPTDLIRQHARLGDELLIFVMGLFVVCTALVWFDRYRRRAEGPGAARRVPAKLVIVTLTVLTVGLAVTSAVQVVRIGDSGARAVWSDTRYIPPRPHQADG